MTRRRDVLGYLGMAGAWQLAAGKTARAGAKGRTIIPFTLAGRAGRVAVAYGVTADPVAAGFDVIPNLPFDIALCRGYPNIHAVIEARGASGYRGLCGWIQVITGERYRGGSGDTAPAETAVDVDRLPSIANMDMPFSVFGYLPEWFDAPCRNLNGFERLRWQADTFLATVPLKSRAEAIQRLAGFRWGYLEYDPASHRPVVPLPLEVTGAEAWNGLLPSLRQSCPGWRFAAAA